MDIHPTYISIHNTNRKKQVILLLIPNRGMASSCSKKIIGIIKRNSDKT